MNETIMTVVGNLVDAPNLRRTKNGHLVANFRIASTSRRYDRDKGEWIDSGTLFVTVTAWRALAQNVGDSLKKGQPVMVMGRYYQREFTSNEVLRTAYELEATAVGHDLTRGVADFERVVRPAMSTPIDLDDDGHPADLTADYLDLDETSPNTEVDLATGEVRELTAV
ncbi:MAG: single-stranded DNA-binding protein [Jatrophihabitans sp.]